MAGFLVTVDTEADNEWTLAERRSFTSISRLPQFQECCDRYGVRPTYLVTYDVTEDDRSRDVLQQLQATERCEMGAHLHAWSTPPHHELIPGLFRHNPYLHEYPPEIQQAKLHNLTAALRSAYGGEPLSYRGGRWSFDEQAALLLKRAGYLVDSTVTPGVSWQANPGYSPGASGPSFAGASPTPFRLQTGAGQLLEVPVSIAARGLLKSVAGARRSSPLEALGRRLLHKAGLCRLVWLRPGFSSTADMIWVCEELQRRAAPVLNLMFHSSELVAGGSPRIRSAAVAQDFSDALDRIFAYVTRNLGARCLTLSEYARQWVEPGASSYEREQAAPGTSGTEQWSAAPPEAGR